MAQYRTGTATISNGDATVTGVGTSWLSNLSIGDIFIRIGDSVQYFVGSITNDTELELTSPYVGVTGSGVSYAVTTDFTPNSALGLLSPTDLETAITFNANMTTIDEALADRPTNEEFGDLTLGRNWKAWSNTGATAKWQKIATLDTTEISYRGTINLSTGNGYSSGGDNSAYSIVINLTSGNKLSIDNLLAEAFILGGVPSTGWRVKTKSLGSNIFELWVYCPSYSGGIASYLGEIPLTTHTNITGSEPTGDVYEKTVYKLSYTAL